MLWTHQQERTTPPRVCPSYSTCPSTDLLTGAWQG